MFLHLSGWISSEWLQVDLLLLFNEKHPISKYEYTLWETEFNANGQLRVSLQWGSLYLFASDMIHIDDIYIYIHI